LKTSNERWVSAELFPTANISVQGGGRHFAAWLDGTDPLFGAQNAMFLQNTNLLPRQARDKPAGKDETNERFSAGKIADVYMKNMCEDFGCEDHW
jgi:hypothetical protein